MSTFQNQFDLKKVTKVGFTGFFLMSFQLVSAADVVVIGSKESQAQLTGSGQFIETEEIRSKNTGNINDLLRRNVPGVTLFEEDGYGLFPNISFRGVNSSRSGRITMMEDGILMAPAPLSAPAAYYSPFVSRMSGVEALKGSSQVQYGPSTTGGVLNYLSTPLPLEQESYVKIMHGSHRETHSHVYHGDKIGGFSYLIEAASRHTNGFRTIDDLDNASFDRENTGHRIFDPSIKLGYEFSTPLEQSIEFKFGRYQMNANETYLGLTDEDFNRNPHRRYSASRFDNIDTQHDRTSLRHHINFSENSELTTTAYYNRFYRNWYKLHNLRSNSTDAFASPLSNPDHYDILRGRDSGELRVRANQRNYESRGVQQRWSQALGDHQLTLGWRFHRDRIKRFQFDDFYTQNTDGVITDITRSAPGAAGDRNEKGSSISFYVQDEWFVSDRLTLMPGIRFERVDYTYLNRGDEAARENSLTVINPAVSFRYLLSNQNQIFGGVYKGSALPGPNAATREVEPLKDEKSYNYELGLRSQGDFFALETTLFYTQLRDLLALESTASGNESDQSIGKASSYGLELKSEVDLGALREWSFSNRWYVVGTFSKAEIGGDYQDSGYLTGTKGNQLPYSPDLQLTFGTAIETQNYGFDLWGTFVDDMYRTGENLEKDLIDSHLIFNASAYARISENSRIIVQSENIFDKDYMTSRTPYGARSGKPFTVLAGFEASF